MATMAKKKSSPSTSARPGFTPFNFWLEDDVAAAMKSFFSDQELKSSKTEFFRKAVIEYLSKRGHWPAKNTQAKGDQ